MLDTNIYLDLREYLGVDANGRLARSVSDVDCGDHGAVVSATHLGHFEVSYVVPIAVKNELFHCLKHGYTQRPIGLNDPRLVAAALRDLIDLTPPDRTTFGTTYQPSQLSDPPLPAREQNDRRIYHEVRQSRAILITRDDRLQRAVKALKRPICPALTPAEFVTGAIALERMTDIGEETTDLFAT